MLTRIQKGSNVYAVMNMEDMTNDIDKVSLMMINSNQNQNIGLAPVSFEEMNGVYEKMLFDVTGRVTLHEYITKKISQDAFKKMLINLIETIEQFDEYMIDVMQIILDIDSVFINEIDNTVSFICVPLKDLKQQGKLYEFFKNIVETSYVEWNGNEVSYFNGVYNIVKSENGFSLQNMKTAMKSQKENAKEVSYQSPVQTKNYTQSAKPEKKIEEPSTITVTAPPVAVPTPVVQEEVKEESKGLFGKLFSSSKKKEKKKKEKPEKTSNTGFQGGLAGLKNGNKSVSQPVGQNPQISGQPTQNPQFTNNIPNSVPPVQKNNDFMGTTSLKSSVSQNNSPASVQQPVQQNSFQMPQQPPVQQSPVQTPVQQNPFQAQPTEINIDDNSHKINLFKSSAPENNNQIPQQDFAETTSLKRSGQQNESAETTSLKNSSPETTSLKSPVMVRAFLVRCKSHENIEIRKPVFFIGRDNPEQDYCINDNTAVGHRHAQIFRQGTDFELMDMNSKNCTYINGMELVPRRKYRINNGDKITFADEEFEFRVIF